MPRIRVLVKRESLAACIKVTNDEGRELSIAFNRHPEPYGGSWALSFDQARFYDTEEDAIGEDASVYTSEEVIVMMARHLGYKVTKSGE